MFGIFIMQFFLHKRYDDDKVYAIVGLYNFLLGTFVMSCMLQDVLIGWIAGVIIIAVATKSNLVRIAIVIMLLLAATL